MAAAQSLSIALTEVTANENLLAILRKFQYAHLTRLLTSGGLVISATKTKAKIANTIKYMIYGNVYTKATADMAALAGTIANTKFGAWYFFIDAAGALTTVAGTLTAATLEAIVPPLTSWDGSKACIGMLIVNPTGTGSFVGGTTELDDATVVPNAVYVDFTAPYNPNIVAL